MSETSATPIEAPQPPVVAAAPAASPAPVEAAPVLPVVAAPVAKSAPAKPRRAPRKAAAPAPAPKAENKPAAKPARAKPAAPRSAKPKEVVATIAPAAPKRAAPPPRKSPTKSKTPITPLPKAAKAPAPLPKSKDTTMATKTPLDFTAPFKTAFADLQEKAKAAYEKGNAAIGEANEFAKGNVEAVVESGKILATGLQELGTTLATESRTAFETLTAEAKELAAVKSPTEFFQLQSSLLRKHFDAVVAQTSKNTEAVLKLANEAVAPISNRVTLAVEKASKAA